MKIKKLLSILLAGVMVFSMAACGEEGSEGTNGTTGQSGTNQVEGASIDFEDGNSAFVMMSTKPRKADDAKVSVKDYNGSKALYVENLTGGELYIGIDVDALLGDKVTEVASIQMDIGTEYADGSFSASAGNLYAYTGADLAENKLDGWSIYMENKNPKTVTFTMDDNDGNSISFTAGNNNYIVLVKDDDTGTVASSMYIDNIAFIDANGNVLTADTTVVMDEPFEGYRKVVKEEEPAAPGSVTVALDEAYVGDWGATAAIPAAEFAAFSGDVTVTLKYEVESGYDYYLLNPIDFADWATMKDYYTDLTPATAAPEGGTYHLQDDGFIVIDSMAAGEITFTISAAGVEKIKNGAAGLSGQTYGVTVYEAVLTGTAGVASASKTVALDESYMGDWSATTAIPATEFAGMSGDVTVTLKFELESGYDYYLLNPINAADWVSMKGYYTDLTPKSAAEEGDLYHLQDDGFIVIDDWTNGTMTFTISADAVAAIVNGGAGLAGQTYGVTVYEAVLTSAATSAPASKTVAMDESYVGDWGAITAIPAAEFAGLNGDVTVSFKFELESGYDYYLLAPMDLADWGRLTDSYTDLTPKSAAEEGELYHLQDDGFIVIDDQTNDTLTVTLSAAAVEKIVNGGAGLSGQTYGLTVYEAVITGGSTSAPAASESTTVAVDDDYVGDWGAITAIPVTEFEGKSGDVTVTFKFELEGGYDYYLIAPIDYADWAKLNDYYTDLTAKSAADEGDLYHLQDDGFIVIDDLSNDTLTFTISAAGVEKIVNGGVGLSAQVYGVVVYEVEIQ